MSGSVTGRRLEVIGSGLANEAVSPDGKQLLVKKQTGDRGFWQLVVLDLDSRREITLNQGSRSVDDQVEWLDAGHVVYHDVTEDGTGIWMLADRRHHRPPAPGGRRLLAGGAALTRGARIK